jgi:hypothetical protein
MPQPHHKKISKIPFKSLGVNKNDASSLKSNVPSFHNLTKSKQLSLPKKTLDSDSRKTRIVGDGSSKLAANKFSGKEPLKSKNVIMKRPLKKDSTFLNKKVTSAQINAESFMQNDKSSPFLSILKNKGRIRKNKITTQIRQKILSPSEENGRLPHAKRLQLFQAARDEPLTFLDLHARFSVSKQMVRGLVKKKFLAEDWGPKAIGVRFKLTEKGKVYLKQLEEAARYESGIKERASIRLKNKAYVQ